MSPPGRLLSTRVVRRRFESMPIDFGTPGAQSMSPAKPGFRFPLLVNSPSFFLVFSPKSHQRSMIQPVLRPPRLSERDNTPRGTPQRRRRKRDDDFFSFSSCIMPHTPHHFKLGLLTGSSRRKALYIDLYSHCRFKYIYNRKMLSNQILLCVLLVIACSRAGAFAPSSPAKNNFATIMRAEEEGATATSNGVESYVRCGRCQTSYSLTEEQLGKGRGR